MSLADTLTLALQRTCENDSKCYDQPPHRTKSIMWTLAFSPQLIEQWHCWMWRAPNNVQPDISDYYRHVFTPALAVDVFRHYSTSRLDVFAVVIRMFFLARTSHTFFGLTAPHCPVRNLCPCAQRLHRGCKASVVSRDVGMCVYCTFGAITCIVTGVIPWPGGSASTMKVLSDQFNCTCYFLSFIVNVRVCRVVWRYSAVFKLNLVDMICEKFYGVCLRQHIVFSGRDFYKRCWNFGWCDHRTSELILIYLTTLSVAQIT